MKFGIIVLIYTLIIIISAVVVGIIIYKMITKTKISPNEFLGLLTILSSQVQTELDAYDKDIFENKGAITNNNFEQYYRDLTSRIVNNIAPEMIDNLSQYYTEEAVYRFIARSVKDYLLTKINGTI